MSLFAMPIRIVNRSEKLQRDFFFFCGKEKGMVLNLVWWIVGGWGEGCSPSNEGGLGICKVALLIKLFLKSDYGDLG